MLLFSEQAGEASATAGKPWPSCRGRSRCAELSLQSGCHRQRSTDPDPSSDTLPPWVCRGSRDVCRRERGLGAHVLTAHCTYAPEHIRKQNKGFAGHISHFLTINHTANCVLSWLKSAHSSREISDWCEGNQPYKTAESLRRDHSVQLLINAVSLSPCGLLQQGASTGRMG